MSDIIATNLDEQQIMQQVYDETNHALRVSATIVAEIGELAVEIDQSNDSILIYGNDGTTNRPIRTKSDGTVVIDVDDFIKTTVSSFNEITSVPSAALTTIITYTVPGSTSAQLIRAELSGTNIATYNFYVNSVLSGKKRTYFSGGLDTTFDFIEDNLTQNGLPLNSGDIVEIKVIHSRPMVGTFDARIQAIEYT